MAEVGEPAVAHPATVVGVPAARTACPIVASRTHLFAPDVPSLACVILYQPGVQFVPDLM